MEILTLGRGRNDLMSEIKIESIRYKRKPFNLPGYTEAGLLDSLGIKLMHNIFSCISQDFYFSSDTKHGITHHATKSQFS